MAGSKSRARVLRAADMVVEGRDGRPVLLVEVKVRRLDARSTSSLIHELGSSGPLVPFAMIVDPDRIQVFQRQEEHLVGPVLTMKASPVLRYYSDAFDEFLSKGIRESFMETLVVAWLRNLNYQWKSKSSGAPGADRLARIGLLPLLKELDDPVRGGRR